MYCYYDFSILGVSQITAVHVGWFIHIIPNFYPCNFALLSSVIIFIYLFFLLLLSDNPVKLVSRCIGLLLNDII